MCAGTLVFSHVGAHDDCLLPPPPETFASQVGRQIKGRQTSDLAAACELRARLLKACPSFLRSEPQKWRNGFLVVLKNAGVFVLDRQVNKSQPVGQPRRLEMRQVLTQICLKFRHAENGQRHHRLMLNIHSFHVEMLVVLPHTKATKIG